MWPEHWYYFSGCCTWVDIVCIWDVRRVLNFITVFKLLVYDVWFAKDYKKGFLSVRVDTFGWLYLKEQPISLPMATMSSIKQLYDSEKTQQKSKHVKILIHNQSIMFGLSLPYGNTRKIEKCQIIYFDECSK